MKILYPLLLSVLMVTGNRLNAQTILSPQPTLPTQSFAEVVAIGDVNNDGMNDVVVGNTFYFAPGWDFHILVYLQNSQHKLNPPVLYPYAASFSYIQAIKITDINNDQKNDVVVGFGDSVGIFYQSATGTLNAIAKHYAGTTIQGLDVGNLNNDGNKDIAVSAAGSGTMNILYGGFSGFTLQSFTNASSGGGDLRVADINDDGKDDVIQLFGMMNSSAGIQVFTQTASGGMNNAVSYVLPIVSFNTFNGIAVADLNNDGLNDVMATRGGNSPTSQLVIWYQHATTHQLQSGISLNAYDIPTPVAAADMDCDGDKEILIGHLGWASVSMYTPGSSGAYGPYSLQYIQANGPQSPYGLAVGDINSDGRKDILIADHSGLVPILNKTVAANATVTLNTAIDTFYRGTVSSTSFTTTWQAPDTVGNFVVLRRDTILVTSYNMIDSVQYDTVKVMTGVVCGQNQVDTFYYSGKTGSYYTVQDSVIIGTGTIILFALDVPALSQHAVDVFPNPVQGEAAIPLTEQGILKAAVWDMSGKSVATISLQPPYRLDCRSLSSGTYLLSITNQQGKRFYGRFVKR
jgi:hypothetical protein